MLKINPGFDASYPWRQIGTGDLAAGSPLDYYLAPADKGGEPPGQWAGRGLAALGFAEGAMIDRAVFEPLFGQHVDPRDSSGESRLGRAPQRFASEDDIYRELAAAEPHATEARKSELRTLARAETRHAVPFWDVTVSVSKSVTLFYGGWLALAERARQEGDEVRAASMERQAARVWEAIMEGNAAALEYLQDEAGLTRTGYHRGTGAESLAELGKWEHARNWIIGSFRQHTSRTGDPQLHVHNLVLAKVVTERDGNWRKLDSKALYRFQGAASAVAAAVMETALTRMFGVAWVPRRDGHGREIAGISQELMDAFSSRRQTIVEQARRIADQRELEHGRRPDARQMDRIQRDLALRTRPPKSGESLDLREKLREWKTQAREQDLGELASIPAAVAEAASRTEPPAPVRRLAQEMAAEFERRQGRAPDRLELERMERFADFATRRGAEAGSADPALLLRAWEAQEQSDEQAQHRLRREIGRAQAQAASERMAEQKQERIAEQERLRIRIPVTQLRGPAGLTDEEARRVMAAAVAIVQTKMTTWTKADLIRHVGESLPAGAMADRATLELLADRALVGSAGEAVELLSAPEWPRVPDSLRRSDGESVFRPHGAERYASQAQLTLEERLKAQAVGTGGPKMSPDVAAAMLGTDRVRLEERLRPEATNSAAMTEVTGIGLRMDQAAAAFFVLTSPRRAEIMVGPPGTGKTRTAVEIARIWTEAEMGPVVALTTSSNARNVIREEAARHGVELQAYNTAEWLGRSPYPGDPGRPVELRPGTLLTLDEASMMSLAYLAAIVSRAVVHGAKVVVTGDPMQLQAVETGGGMSMLTRTLGSVRLSEAGRFRHGWESEASLRLRDGDVTVLTEYRQNGRLHAGHSEEVLECAARAYLHDRLNGAHTVLMAATDSMAAELARRVRGDLIAWGMVSDGPVIGLRDGAVASPGDWIMARKNASQITAGQPGRTLANRDILRIASVQAGAAGRLVEVQRLTGRDAASGRESWSVPFLLSRAYLRENAQLAYAVTFHSAEGQTVDSGIAVFTGEEDRQAVNVAMTRGRDRNEAWVIAGWRLADPGPGPLPAAELARYDRRAREAAGQDRDVPSTAAGVAVAEQVLGKCLARDGQELSATETRSAAWSDADRLDVLGVQWQHVVGEATRRRYEAAVRNALRDSQADQVMSDPAATWLWRSLREAEAAGLDGPSVLGSAVASGPLEDAESIAKVVDWRIRQQIIGLPAMASRSFPDQVPVTGDAEMDRFARELATAMDDRQRRLGEHAAEPQPGWAEGLGALPEHTLDRVGWEHRAGQVAAYREMWGWTHPHDPIGPRPGQHSPEARSSWQAAAEALGYVPGSLREHSDGKLWAWRSAFANEMAWAPPHKGDDLATVRAEIRRTQIEADRARRNAEAAVTDQARQCLADRAEVLARWEEMAGDLAERLIEAQAAYDAWERVTGPTRERAVAADAELRRRYPDDTIELLQGHVEAAEPKPTKPSASAPGPAAWADSSPVPGRFDQIAAQLGLIGERLDEAAMHKARQAQERAAEISSMQAAPDDPDAEPVAAWKTELEARQREAVRSQPMPRVPHAHAITAQADRGLEPEAAD
ncbi:MAG TPA: MobF family relaxase [Streptosporangiaceae bacterium]|nr:MobF family relaxase [Streptosporangiaceae bacterium]